MQKMIAIIVMIILVAFIGCIGESDGGNDKTRLIQKNGTLQQITGWAESNWNETDDSNVIANLSIPININHNNITTLKFSIEIEDSDTEHDETDQGSNPDIITIIISGENQTETQKGVTPLTYSSEFSSTGESQEISYLSQDWHIQINADCSGGKPKSGSLSFSTHKDHGFAYTINGEYTYTVEEVITVEEQNDDIQFPIISSILALLIIVILIIIFVTIRWKKKLN
jgi:hypothetical protein